MLMRQVRRFNIGWRLGIAFSLIIASTAGIGWFALNRLNTVNASMTALHDHAFDVSNDSRDAELHLVKVSRAIRDMMLTTDPAQLSDLARQVDENSNGCAAELARVKAKIEGDPAEVAVLQQSFTSLPPLWNEEVKLARSNRKAEAIQMVRTRSYPISAKLEADLGALVDKSSGEADNLEVYAQAAVSNARAALIVTMLIVVLAGVGLASLLTSSIVNPLRAAVGLAIRVSEGDLTADVSAAESTDEVGKLFKALTTMTAGLREQIREISAGVAVLTSSASELASSSTQFAASSTETAASVSQTTATVEEVKQTSRVATEKAQEVADRAQFTIQVSHQGQSSVNATLEGIQHIRRQMAFIAESVVKLSEQSQAISDIISSVDDLAEQSNLLAVNASIEAAKAGEHGKGFGVVAREVKSLAEQSRQATRQVRTILSDIQKATSATVMATEQGSKSVDSGVSQATEVGEALRNLSQSISDWAMMMQQIVSTTQQQYIGIDQVTLAMESIKVASAQNVSGARQLEGASRGLDDLGRRLQALVAHYKV